MKLVVKEVCHINNFFDIEDVSIQIPYSYPITASDIKAIISQHLYNLGKNDFYINKDNLEDVTKVIKQGFEYIHTIWNHNKNYPIDNVYAHIALYCENEEENLELKKYDLFSILDFSVVDLVENDLLSVEEVKQLTYNDLLEIVTLVREMFTANDLLDSLRMAIETYKNKKENNN